MGDPGFAEATETLPWNPKIIPFEAAARLERRAALKHLGTLYRLLDPTDLARVVEHMQTRIKISGRIIGARALRSITQGVVNNPSGPSLNETVTRAINHDMPF